VLTPQGVAVSSFEIHEQDRPLLTRASTAHDVATTLGLALAQWRNGVAVRDELVGCERAWMSTVRVEGDEEGRPLVDEAYACMGMAVDAALVSLGEPEPPLEVQVVAGEVAATAVDEQPGSEALHHAGHVVVEWRGRCPIPEGDLVEVGPATAGRAEVGIEGAVDEAEFDNVASYLLEGGLRVGEPLVDARHELRQLAIAGPPFFGSTQR
jgi:hypothetical protein